MTRAQLVAAGVAPDVIDRRIKSGRLHPVHRGVYLVGHTVPAPLALETAALLACAPGAALSHGSAAKLWEIHAPADAVPIDVTVRGQRRPKQGVRLHRAKLQRTEVRKRHGLWLTDPARTLKDLAATLPHAELEWTVANAHRQRLIDPERLAEEATGAPGAKRLRRVLQGGPRFTRSDGERALLAVCRRAKLPLPDTNLHLHGWEIDAIWPDRRLVVEVDGYWYHLASAEFHRDHRKDSDLDARGYRVIRVSYRQLLDEPEAVASRLARALATEPSSPG